MEIIPAIDLRAGVVVRLLQGDYDQQTTFADNPVSVALGFEMAGARRIHVVDLDGAKEGQRTQADEIRAVVQSVRVPIELGGGLRSITDVAAAFAEGVDRVVLGTAAIENPGLVEKALVQFGPNRVLIGLDAREGIIAVSGWTAESSLEATDLLDRMASIGVERFIYTDITRDGTMTSPNFDAVQEMVNHGSHAGNVRVIASGGIASIEHLRRLAEIGVEGAIVGSAVYRGTLNLEQAIAELAPGTD